jgi:hypothetical protein
MASHMLTGIDQAGFTGLGLYPGQLRHRAGFRKPFASLRDSGTVSAMALSGYPVNCFTPRDTELSAGQPWPRCRNGRWPHLEPGTIGKIAAHLFGSICGDDHPYQINLCGSRRPTAADQLREYSAIWSRALFGDGHAPL